jgi:hypothetical protein
MKVKNFMGRGRASNWEGSLTYSLLSIGVFNDDQKIYDAGMSLFNWLLPRYVYPNGQLGETKRDSTHAEMGLVALIYSAEVAWNQGDDMYGKLDSRLREGMEFKTGTFGALPGWEIGLHHYETRAKLPMTKTRAAVVKKGRPEKLRWNFLSFVGATHAFK